MRFNISYDIVAVAIILILLFVYGEKCRRSSSTSRSYYYFAISALASASLDIATVIIEKYSDYYSSAVIFGVNTLFLIIQGLVVLLFAAYTFNVAEIPLNSLKKKLLIRIPFYIYVLLLLTNPFTKLLFYIDEKKVYRHSTFFPLLYAIAALYLIICTVVIIKQRKKLERRIVVRMSFYIILAGGSQILQALMNRQLIVSFATSLCLILIVYNIQNPDEIYDKTNAMRKNVFMNNILSSFSSEDRFIIISIKIHDIDSFYKSLGDDCADSLLQMVTAYLRKLNKKATVFHANAETFMVKLPAYSDEAIKNLLENLRSRFEHEWRNRDGVAFFTVSFGVIKCPENVSDVSELSDAISYMCELNAAAGSVTYAESIEGIKRNRQILNAIKKAVIENSFQVYYQPIYSEDKKRITAAEALIRLIDDELGFISPEVFIPIAEEEGYILKIGQFVFEEVCSFYANNDLAKAGIEYIEVNISAIQCMQYRLVDEFTEIMDTYDIKPSQINLEITETAAVISFSSLSSNINKFSKMGVSLSLDDYGTGYSNISYIYNLPFNYMKIDKSTLWSAVKNPQAKITLINTVDMAKKLNLSIIVEGVETEEQIKLLRSLKCDYFQGYYFSKPVPGKNFMEYIQNFALPECCK